MTADVSAVDAAGWWAVVVDFDGPATCVRFRDVRACPVAPSAGWPGVPLEAWRSSLSAQEYQEAVRTTQQHIVDGTVYQANICRVMSAALPRGGAVPYSPAGLHAAIAGGNPAPYAGFVDAAGVRVVSASPELYLSVAEGRVSSGPIKGTGRTAADLTPKDEAENVMIVDLVRNDLSRVCDPGSIAVPHLLSVEHHPGLVHLVSTVTGELKPSVTVSEALQATFPPASVTGAPKSTALQIIDALETERRGPYCGAVGFVDADRGVARLAVGIRSFWWDEGALKFGTGAGITAESHPFAEWQETQLKAARLTTLASHRRPG